MNKEQFEKENVFGKGSPNNAYAQYFVGNSYLNPLTNLKETNVFLANATFEPGCRNNWHIHHAKSGGGQILICTAGSGWYQEFGKEAVSLEPGMVITIPAGVTTFTIVTSEQDMSTYDSISAPEKVESYLAIAATGDFSVVLPLMLVLFGGAAVIVASKKRFA